MLGLLFFIVADQCGFKQYPKLYVCYLRFLCLTFEIKNI